MKLGDHASDICRYIQDPIHGTIALSKLECSVIDHPVMQRLRQIRQLGNASLIFPGATHTRFCHAIGVMHQAGELFAALTRPFVDGKQGRPVSARVRRALAQVQQRVRLAGLLHDVGHGPFSHHFEHVLEESDTRVSSLSGTGLAVPLTWIQMRSRAAYLEEPLRHEHFSAALIASLGLDEGLTRAILSLLDTRFLSGPAMEEDLRCLADAAGAPQAAWSSLLDCLRSLISSEIDADRMDYLRRDAYFCGVNVGFDAAHLVRSLTLTHEERRFYIAVEPNAVFALEQLLLARKQMFSQVYQNRANLLLDHLLSLAMAHLTAHGQLAVPRSVGEFLQLDDTSIMQALRGLVRDREVNATPDRQGDLALKMYLTRCLPVTLATMDVPASDWTKLSRSLRKRWPRSEILVSPAKDLLGGHDDKAHQDGPLSQRGRRPRISRIVTQHGKRGRFVPVAEASELVRSKAWRFSAYRIVVTKSLFDSARERQLDDRLTALVAESQPTSSLRLVMMGAGGSTGTARGRGR